MPYSIDAVTADCYPDTAVLINKFDLRKQEALDRAEAVAVTVHSIEVENEPMPDAFTFDFYCGLHRRLFGDIYSWAGEIRKINISKKGTQFYDFRELKSCGQLLFQRFEQFDKVKSFDKDEFAEWIAEIYGDLNMLHPFREGNGRTERLFITLVIKSAGYKINFSASDPDELMIATIFAAQGVDEQLKNFFRKNNIIKQPFPRIYSRAGA